MIFRAHAPHQPNGKFGKLLGYISLCPNFISNQLIFDRLREHKLSQDWLLPHELETQVASASPIPGIYAYNVFRILPTRPNRKLLYYLWPIETPKELPATPTLDSVITFTTTNWGTTVSTNTMPIQPIQYYRQPIQPIQYYDPDNNQ